MPKRAAGIRLAALITVLVAGPADAQALHYTLSTQLPAAGRIILVQDSGDEQGEIIRNFQRSLRDLGLYNGMIDGVPGPGTQRAFDRFLDIAVPRQEKPSVDEVERLLWAATEIRGSREVSGPQAIRQAPQLLHAMRVSRAGTNAIDENQYAEAEELYRRALEACQRILGTEHFRTLNLYMAVANSIFSQGRYAESEALMRRILEVQERVLGQEHRHTLQTRSNLALSIDSQGRHAEAELHYRRVFEQLEQVLGPEHPETLTTRNNLAGSIHSQNRAAEAEALYRRVLEARAHVLGPNHRNTLQTRGNLALTLDSQGRAVEAEALFKRTLEVQEQILGPYHHDTLRTVNNLANVINAQGRAAEAEALFRLGFEAHERVLGAQHPETLSTLNNLANSIGSQRRHAEAEALYLRVAETRDRVLGPEHPDTLLVLANLANSIRRQARHAEAEALYRRVLGALTHTHGPSHPDTLKTRNNLAFNALGAGDLPDALRTWEDGFAALPAYFDFYGRDAAEQLSLDFERYLIAAALPEISSVETARRSFEAQGWLTFGQLDVTLSDLGARREVGSGRRNVALRSLQEAREGRLAAQQAYLDSFERDADEAVRARLSERLKDAEAAFQRESSRISEEFPALAEVELPRALTADEAQNLLEPGEGLVAYASTEETLYAWLVTSEEVSWTQINLPRNELADAVARLRGSVDLSMAAPEAAKRDCALRGDQRYLEGRPFDLCAANDLEHKVLGDFDLSEIDELIVVPDGPLETLPFSMLVAERAEDGTPRWLIEDHAISVLPSTSSLRALRRSEEARRSDGKAPYLGIAPVTFDASDNSSPLRNRIRSLPATEDEVRLISGLLGAGEEGTVVRSAASEAWLTKAPLERYKVISFATHGLLSREARDVTGGAIEEPALLLRAGGGEDGFLTASEVTGLRLDADWVLLSACNTAAGDGDDAEGLSGLARAFFFAGARSLLVSHWAVDDAAAMELMIETMERAAKSEGLSRAQALRQARLSVMNQQDRVHPFYWAPFDLVGENG